MRIMQTIGVGLPRRRMWWRDQSAVAIGGDDVFGDRARFRDDVAIVGDDRRFAERMNLAQLFRRAHIGLTLIADDIVGNAELFQQPQHPLRARIVEMMNGQHGCPPDIGAWRGGLVPAGGAKVETRGASQYYPDFIDGMNLSG